MADAPAAAAVAAVIAANATATAGETTIWSKEKTEVKDGKTIHTKESESVGPDGIAMHRKEEEKTYLDKDGKEHTKIKIETKPVYD